MKPLHPFAAPAIALILSLALVSCGGEEAASSGQGGPRVAKGDTAAKGGDSSQRRPGVPAAPVAIEAAVRGPIASYYSTTATLEAEKQAQILARVAGVVTRILSEEGDTVNAGQTLLQIEDQEYRLRVAQAEATVETQKSRHQRLKGLFEANLASAEEFDAARSDFRNAEAELELAELNLSYTKVRAPFPGRVVARMVDVGQNVSNGTALFAVADFDPLLAEVHVPSKEFRRLQPDQPVELHLDSNGATLRGTIKLVSPVIDPTSGTIKVTLEIPDYPEDTRPGDFAEVRIVTERREDVVLVPKVAVVTEKSEQVVYVAEDDVAVRRVVTLGFQDDDHSQILNGVSAGEMVVVKGQRSLKEGQSLNILEDSGSSSANATAAP